MVKVDLQPAYVLHSRHYRETSLLVDLLTPDYGRLSVVARGASGPRSGLRYCLQPFRRLAVSWYGKGELKTLKSAEEHACIRLEGDALFSGIYLNELLMRLLGGQDGCEQIFILYERVIAAMAQTTQIQPVLRIFELNLLEQLGYAISFPETSAVENNSNGQHPSAPRVEKYCYDVGGTFIAVHSTAEIGDSARYFTSTELSAISKGDYSDQKIFPAAKRLMRLALAPLLGGRVLNSRKLFIQQRRPGR